MSSSAINFVLKLLIRDREISFDDINRELARRSFTPLSPIAISSIKARPNKLKLSYRYSCSDDPDDGGRYGRG
jgi:hypothetical protein